MTETATTATKFAPGTLVRFRPSTTLVARFGTEPVEVLDETKVRQDGRRLAVEPSLSLVRIPDGRPFPNQGWEGRLVETDTPIRCWWVSPEDCEAVTPEPTAPAGDEVIVNGHAYPATSLIAQADTYSRTLPVDSPSRGMLGRVLDSLVVQERRVRELEATVDRQTAAARETRERINRMVSDRDDFGARVREVLITKGRENGACDEGINRALESLGLDPIEEEYDVTVEVTMRHRVTVTVKASSPDTAQEEIGEDEVREAMDAEGIGDPAHFDSWDFEVEDARLSD